MNEHEQQHEEENVEERREYVRLPFDKEMMVRYGHKGQVFFGSCHNLSPGGIFVATKNPAPFGSMITMKFTLPGHHRPLKARGRVVRIHRDTRSRSQSNPPGMHVLFTQMSNRTENELKHFIVPRLRQHVIRQLAERRRDS
ncbi:MAG: hypothetical protein EP343_13965 [Deltaproteobacteria bacterium]|nr:MAG: hypothetical protein EP343_13965 [Deltaproteobacteria bacterium]